MTKEEFLKGMDNACNHRVLLWEALEATTGPVVEFGSGHGSTPFLLDYCLANNREFLSYDNNKEWADKTGAVCIRDWDEVPVMPCSVLLIDHAPGERRKIDILKYKDIAEVIVCHDTEPAADHGYKMRKTFQEFNFVQEYESPGAWATLLTNNFEIFQKIGLGQLTVNQ